MALASLYEVGVHAYSRDVRLLLILLSLSTHLVWASECEDILAKAGTDRAGRNFYFNRWNLPDGMNAETVMDAAVQKVTVELHRP